MQKAKAKKNRTARVAFSSSTSSHQELGCANEKSISQDPKKNFNVLAKPKSGGTIKCFKCQGFGHVAVECPNQRVINLVKEFIDTLEENPMKGQPVYDDYNEDDEDEITWSNHRESLVIWRSMNVAKIEEDLEWL